MGWQKCILKCNFEMWMIRIKNSVIDFLTFFSIFWWSLTIKRMSLKISLQWTEQCNSFNESLFNQNRTKKDSSRKIKIRLEFKKTTKKIFTKNLWKALQAHLNELLIKMKKWSINPEDLMWMKLLLQLSSQQTAQITHHRDKSKSFFKKKLMKFWCNTNRNQFILSERKGLELALWCLKASGMLMKKSFYQRRNWMIHEQRDDLTSLQSWRDLIKTLINTTYLMTHCLTRNKLSNLKNALDNKSN